MKFLLSLVLLTYNPIANFAGSEVADPTASQALFLMHKGDVKKAVVAYQSYTASKGGHDYSLLRQMAMILLERGEASPNLEDQLMAVFGAGISTSPELLPILRAGMASKHPQVQLACVNLLSQFHHDEADDLLSRALSSPFLVIRLEAVYQLALKRHPSAPSQIEALMAKVPKQIHPLFPRLFALTNHRDADVMLRRMLADSDSNVRCATILSISRAGRDDFLPAIRQMAYQLDSRQQEVCASGLGRLADGSALSRLEQLSNSSQQAVKISSLQALYHLDREESRRELEELALRGNPFAIGALAEMPGAEETLARLLYSSDPVIRVNASASLLILRDRRALQNMRELFLRDARDLLLVPTFSPGGALMAIDVIPSGHQHARDKPLLPEVSRSLREALLVEALHLDESDFLNLAHLLFESQQPDLIPLLVRLLENLGTPQAIALIKQERDRAGAPLTRDYCNLALFRLGEEGPYGRDLKEWLGRQKGAGLIQLRPVVPYSERPLDETAYQLSAEEASRLLIESYEALAQRRDEEGVSTLLEAIANGNAHNRYALAGLLIKASE